MEFVKSKRGRDVLLVNGFKFTYNRKAQGKVYWRCVAKGCKSTCITRGTEQMLKKPGEHSHAPLSPGTLKSFSIIKHMRQRIADDPGRPVPRIYNDVVSQALSSSLEATDTLAASLPPFQSIRSTLYRERKKWTPPLPKDGLELQLFNEHKMKKLSCGQGRMIQESPHEHMHKTTLDQHETTSDEHEMTSDERHATSDEHQATSYKRRITSDKHQITSDERQVTVNERQMKSDEHQSTSDERHMTSNKRHMTSSEHQATSNEHQATSDECRMTSDEHQATSDECHMTSDERQPTCGDGIVVKVEHCEDDD